MATDPNPWGGLLGTIGNSYNQQYHDLLSQYQYQHHVLYTPISPTQPIGPDKNLLLLTEEGEDE